LQSELINIMKTLGFNVEGLSFEQCFNVLIQEHIKLMSEIETDNIEFLKQEIRKYLKPTN
jgi:hypothetical protein